MAYLVAFLAAACVVLWTTPTVKAVGLRSGRFDLPADRKVHNRPMVRLGGVSIFLGTIVSLLLVWRTGEFGYMPTEKEYELWGVTVGGLLFFFIGLADDLFQLPASLRLVLQAAVATAAWKVGVSIEFITLPFVGTVDLPDPVSWTVTVLWLVGLANAINWMDGLDGLAAGVSGIAAVILLIVTLLSGQTGAAMIASALAGGSLGFLRYNFRPAQIFMGDGGAYFLGFSLAGIGVIGVAKGLTTLAILLPFCILAVPIIDMSTVIFSRLCQGKSPFLADNRHLHHRLMHAGVPHRLTVLFIYSLTLWMGSLALVMTGLPSGGTYLAGASVIVVVATWEVWKRSRRLSAARRQRLPRQPQTENGAALGQPSEAENGAENGLPHQVASEAPTSEVERGRDR
ncbi:MraY family glycosyltransferase [Synechococcus sp. PCC 7336]|uniref:MraY family glycosyltransferase n=1 Tax=Synechococcus sp. PCC 7336 TaxID=195250 RepID=UPI0003481845|nr:MraY family glycosyltransferase [Synechococcus sp. PCC 7336]